MRFPILNTANCELELQLILTIPLRSGLFDLISDKLVYRKLQTMFV